MNAETSRQIEHRALAWLAKRDGGQWSEADQTEFADWLRADTAHRVTFLRLEAGWERSARLRVFGVGAGKEPRGVPPAGEWRGSPFFERPLAPMIRSAIKVKAPKIAAAAAAVLLVVAAGFYLNGFYSGEAYTTPIGGVASIPLSDGSNVTLNTASKLRVALTKEERRIELEAGEAFFDVANDPLRPFVVQAGHRRIVAVGTQFSVRRDGSEVQVIVTQGKVRIEPRTGVERAELLTAGTVVHTARNALLVQNKSVDEAKEALSWRSGYLAFDETALADAVREFNRYTTQQIVIEDPKLAALKISGKFRSSHAEDFVQLLNKGFGVQVRSVDGSIRLNSN